MRVHAPTSCSAAGPSLWSFGARLHTPSAPVLSCDHVLVPAYPALRSELLRPVGRSFQQQPALVNDHLIIPPWAAAMQPRNPQSTHRVQMPSPSLLSGAFCLQLYSYVTADMPACNMKAAVRCGRRGALDPWAQRAAKTPCRAQRVTPQRRRPARLPVFPPQRRAHHMKGSLLNAGVHDTLRARKASSRAGAQASRAAAATGRFVRVIWRSARPLPLPPHCSPRCGR